MKVRALQMGYYEHKRRRVGDVFDMKDEDYRGKTKVCSWVEPIEQASAAPSKAKVAKKDEQESKGFVPTGDAEVI